MSELSNYYFILTAKEPGVSDYVFKTTDLQETASVCSFLLLEVMHWILYIWKEDENKAVNT